MRLGVTGIQVDLAYNRGGPDDPLRAGDFTFDGLFFSAQYNAETWSLTGEYARRGFDFKNFGAALPDTNFVGDSYYVQAIYKITHGWEAVLRYDAFFANVDDREGESFAVQTGLPAHLFFAKDFTAGLRWDITPNIMVRAEYHHIDGTGWLAVVENPDPAAIKRNWDLLSILVSYRF